MIEEKKLKVFYEILTNYIHELIINVLFHKASPEGLSFLFDLYKDPLFDPVRSCKSKNFVLTIG